MSFLVFWALMSFLNMWYSGTTIDQVKFWFPTRSKYIAAIVFAGPAFWVCAIADSFNK